jgi:SAM-dependent methyltransferase
MTDERPLDLPSPFVAEWVSRLGTPTPPSRRALDVAMGRGRHALLLARAGWHVYGVDLKFDAVREAVRLAACEGLALRAWCGDLTHGALPASGFDLVVVTRYLQRDLFAALADALVPGGVLLYETFTDRQRAMGRGPTSPDHLLKRGELLTLGAGLETLAYAEVAAPEAVARLAARRRHSPS